jgi:hypothetical protein
VTASYFVTLIHLILNQLALFAFVPSALSISFCCRQLRWGSYGHLQAPVLRFHSEQVYRDPFLL